MKMLVALRDVKVGSFLSPVAVHTPGEAERWYADVLGSETQVGKWPDDYPLYEIGKYDDATGQLFPLVNDAGTPIAPRLLLDAQQMKPRLEKEA